MSKLLQVIYASSATQPLSPAQLNLILAKARTRNHVYSITGMLLYHQGSLLQVLEGPEENLTGVLASIERDPRHTDIRFLSRKNIAAREFESWSMGFVDTSGLAASDPAYIDYLRKVKSVTASPTEARRTLRLFYEGLFRQNSHTEV